MIAIVRITSVFVLLAHLSGCGWVDSTGREYNSVPETQLQLEDGASGSISLLVEETQLRINANSSDTDGIVQSYQWSETPVFEGALNACSQFEDFDAERAANSLQEACTSEASCSMVFDEQVIAANGVAEFVVKAPKLKAPVGVTFSLTATDNDGGNGVQEATFCLIAINEAPEAVNDTFTVLEGESLLISKGILNLLSNDTDDIDTSNEPLSVNPEAIRLPASARVFDLYSDGGFTYAYAGAQLSQTVTDTFEYEVTDGIHTSSATVIVRVVASDDPPVLVDNIPLLRFVAGIESVVNLAEYFEDPEGANLSFVVGSGRLSRSGAVTLSSNGVLSGAADNVDVGSYSVTITTSDGSSSIDTNISLVVLENEPVEALEIPSQAVMLGERFTLDVSGYFSDPEEQPLSYSMSSSNSETILNINARTGLISGFFTEAGVHEVTVTASDEVSRDSSISFEVEVESDNNAPVARSVIPNQTIAFGQSIASVSAGFVDPDGDDLLVALVGRAPEGLSTSSGILSGTPTEFGVFSDLRLLATDPSGLSALSNAFTITVTQPAGSGNGTENLPPRYIYNTVFNQGIDLGEPIRSIEPVFIDPEGDELTFIIVGSALPAGVYIDEDTGVVSGTPLVRGWTQEIQIMATDSEGLSTKSDEFWIRVQ